MACEEECVCVEWSLICEPFSRSVFRSRVASARWFVQRALHAKNLLSPDGSDVSDDQGESADDQSVNSLGSSDRD